MSHPVRWLTEKIAIAGQISPEHLQSLADMGFKSIICNRPDNEYGPGQPSAESIRQQLKPSDCSSRFFPSAEMAGPPAMPRRWANCSRACPRRCLLTAIRAAAAWRSLATPPAWACPFPPKEPPPKAGPRATRDTASRRKASRCCCPAAPKRQTRPPRPGCRCCSS